MPKRVSVLSYFGFILTTIFFLNSCNTQNKKEDHKVFRYNESRNITFLDPAFSRNPQNIWPINQLFSGLVKLDKDLGIILEIAHSWTVSPDDLIYNFKLREDVYFHSSLLFGSKKTRKVIASDFVYSFNRLKNPFPAFLGRQLQCVKQNLQVNWNYLGLA